MLLNDEVRRRAAEAPKCSGCNLTPDEIHPLLEPGDRWNYFLFADCPICDPEGASVLIKLRD